MKKSSNLKTGGFGDRLAEEEGKAPGFELVSLTLSDVEDGDVWLRREEDERLSMGFELWISEETILVGLIVEALELSMRGKTFEVGSCCVGTLNGLVAVSTSAKEGDKSIDS